ncbi:MAG: GNAT family N-acetyltransferase [Phormidium sp. BM_Day4_Bin.17]|nr:GNAT family N-acetyltransferase [Phormidium sp. BM_Day4_Bin.17]UCJ12933.1 MAG: GNAT family N-acetyltransferase [Phormidium sp. PBR-2020]
MDSPHEKALNRWLHPDLGMIEAVNYSVSSPVYQQSLTLRDQVLRQPLGLSIWAENLDPETHHGHFGVIQSSAKLAPLLACVVIVPKPQDRVKLRQMAVLPEVQKQGVGTFLIREIEEYLKQHHVRVINLAARVSAIRFYQKLGYRSISPEFLEVGIPHQTLEKTLK